MYPLGGGLAKAIETGEPDGHLEDLPEEEDTAEALGITKLLEVYARSAPTARSWAYEIYADAAPLEASISDRRRAIWVTTAAVFALLWRARPPRPQRVEDDDAQTDVLGSARAPSRTPTSARRRARSRPWRR